MPIINVNDVVYLIMSRLVTQITVSTSIESYCTLSDWARQTANVADVALYVVRLGLTNECSE